MGIVDIEITFDGKAPSLACIAQKVTELSGLPVRVEEMEQEMRRELHDLSGWLAFDCFPEDRIEVRAYRPGAVKEHLAQAGINTWPLAKIVQGANELPDTQTVYVRGYVGQEPTLLMNTALALEALGGQPKPPVPDEIRREFGTPITTAELERRRRKDSNKNLAGCLLGLALFPVLLPYHLLSFCWHIIALPWRLRAARRLIREHATADGDDPA